MTDWTDLRDYVGGNEPDSALLESSFVTAVALVNVYVGTASIPGEVLDRAYLEVGSELFARKNAPSGISQFSTFDGAPIRLARDPLTAARALLDPFRPLGFA